MSFDSFGGMVAGVLKFIEPTGETDSSKRKIWKVECVCGNVECGQRSWLEQFAGHSECPGHPFKGKEKPVEGFRHPFVALMSRQPLSLLGKLRVQLWPQLR